RTDEARQIYGAELALIRPDQVVAWRGSDDRAAESVLARLTGRGWASTRPAPPPRSRARAGAARRRAPDPRVRARRGGGRMVDRFTRAAVGRRPHAHRRRCARACRACRVDGAAPAFGAPLLRPRPRRGARRAG